MKLKQIFNTYVILALFCALYVFAAQRSSLKKSATYDEPINLTAGYSALVLSDYRIDAIHPPLARMWAALPLVLHESIQFQTKRDSWQQGDSWHFSRDFIYEDNSAKDLFASARIMAILLGVVMGLLLFFWARELYGYRVAICILMIYLFEPNMMAHARLVTTDFSVTLGIFATAYALWKSYRYLSWSNVLFLWLASSWAILSKFSALILLPFLLIVGLMRVVDQTPWTTCKAKITLNHTRQRFVGIISLAILLFVGWILLIWLAYGFHYAATPVGTERLVFKTLPEAYQRAAFVSSIVDFVDAYRLLPNAYLQGFLGSLLQSGSRTSYFLGEMVIGGSWTFFPMAILSKTPTALIALFCFSLLWWPAKRRVGFREIRSVVVLMVLFLSALLFAGANLGLRYALPLYPLALIVSAGFLQVIMRENRHRWLALLIPLMMFLEGYAAYPHLLAFYNQLVGGPQNGHHLFLDSNLDWGQDLKGLDAWIEEEKIEHVYLSYFGTADPRSYSFSFTPMIGSPFFLEKEFQTFSGPGYIAISATNLFGEKQKEYLPLIAENPVHIIGHSIYIYRIEREKL